MGKFRIYLYSNNPMKILYIANVRMPTEKAHGVQIMKMCEAWGADHKVTLLAPTRFNHIKADPFDFYGVRRCFKIEKVLSFDLLPLGNILGKAAFWAQNISFAVFATLAVLLKKNDIIFSRDFWSAYFLSLVGKNVVYEIHDSPNRHFITHHAFKKIKKFVATNNFKADELEKDFGVPRKNILAVPNGVDMEFFSVAGGRKGCRHYVDLPEDKDIILYSGHLYSWKGADTLLSAALTSRDPKKLFVFVGGTNDDVLRFQSRAGFRENILILGHQEYKKIPDYLASADILILPNTAKEHISLRETSPIKLFEYMAAGRPVVASDLPSIREVANEKEVVFFRPDDAADLAAKITTVLSDYDKHLKMAEEAKKMVAYYSWGNRAKKILSFAKPKKILFIAGARPNFMKISAMTAAVSLYKDKIESIIIHTGQHYSDELSKIFFEEFKMPAPAVNLNVGSCGRKEQIVKILRDLPKHIEEIKPDLIVVVGDVNSTLAGALAGMMADIPVAHIEAGLRSFNWKMPEEMNRVATDHFSDLLFATEESAVENLKNEGVAQEKIYFTGNVMIDTLLRFSDLAEQSKILETNGLQPKEYALTTLHRAENVDDLSRLKDLVLAMEEIGKNIKLVCPLHPRTEKALADAGIKPNFKIIPPQSYFDFLKLQKNSKFIITDSGGIQEEASILKVPCITIRTETERPATVKYGTNEVVGVDKEKIIAAAKRAMSGDWKVGGEIPLWDGKAAERIMEIIAKYLGVCPV